MASEPSVSSAAPDLIERLRALRSRSGDAAFLGVRLPDSFDPLRLLDDPDAAGVVASYEHPERSFTLVAVGEAARVETAGGQRPADLRDDARLLLEAPADCDEPSLRPRLLAAFRFDPDVAPGAPWDAAGRGALLLPRLLFVRDGDVAGVVLAPHVAPEEVLALLDGLPAVPSTTASMPSSTPAGGCLAVERDIDVERWRGSVDRIAEAVRADRYEKVVLATSMQLRGDDAIPVGRTLARLRERYPQCRLFSIRSGDATFLGASPELLVRVQAGCVQTLGLAGSTARGSDAAEDARLGRALLANAKDRTEHDTVVRVIRERLEGAVEALSAPAEPGLHRFRNIQHLATEITGRTRRGVDVLDLVQRLHPTPAVCGWPQDRAREVIAAHEDFDRGCYAAPVGWIDAAGEGEFAVALRSALVRDERAWLFAGNGIVGDSDPDVELAEVRLKFHPLVEALGDPGGGRSAPSPGAAAGESSNGTA